MMCSTHTGSQMRKNWQNTFASCDGWKRRLLPSVLTLSVFFVCVVCASPSRGQQSPTEMSATSVSIKGRRTAIVSWHPYPDPTANISILSTTDLRLWNEMATVPAAVTKVYLRVDGKERWFALKARTATGTSELSANVRLPASNKISSPRDTDQ